MSQVWLVLKVVGGIVAVAGILWRWGKQARRKSALRLALTRFPQTFDDDMRTTRTKLANGHTLPAEIKHVVAEASLNKRDINREYYDFLKRKSGLLYGQLSASVAGLFVITLLTTGFLTFLLVWERIPEVLRGDTTSADATQAAAYLQDSTFILQMLLVLAVPPIVSMLVSAVGHAWLVHEQVVCGSLRLFRTVGIAKLDDQHKIIEIAAADDDADFKDLTA